MPKIISSSIVSSSDQHDDTQQKLHLYYCLCSEFILVIDTQLEQLPRRRTDDAYIISNASRVYKLNANEGSPKILKRENGFEKQHTLLCPRCTLLLAYETVPQRKTGPYTYIVAGALTETQGVIPKDAGVESGGDSGRGGGDGYRENS